MMIRAALYSATVTALFAVATAAVPAPVAAQTAAAAAPATLTIKFDGAMAPTGAVMVALFDSEAAHDKGGAPVRGGMAKVAGTTAELVIPGLKPGRYAIKAYHDINGNGEMDSNPFGMPLEPFAFSNGAKAVGGPPSWADAGFEVAPGAATVTISFR
ncbi:DUF2141 domain-containing protein [Sandarakinorhabdus sp.]|uniref:DUF2141 domain-containing protein n=1 Tax=Sandarakinorhabdus sp. TaxID=1916663 RepID=UPI00333F0129